MHMDIGVILTVLIFVFGTLLVMLGLIPVVGCPVFQYVLDTIKAVWDFLVDFCVGGRCTRH